MIGRATIHVVALFAGFSAALGGASAARTVPDPMYPAAKCAAFWLGWTDAAKRLRWLSEDPGDAVRAARFRQAALDEGNKAGPVDAYLAGERRNMARMISAAIAGDRQSNDIQNRLMETCERYAAAHGF